MCKITNVVKSIIHEEDKSMANLVGINRALGLQFVENIAKQYSCTEPHLRRPATLKYMVYENMILMNIEQVAVRLAMRSYQNYAGTDIERYEASKKEFTISKLHKQYPKGIDYGLMERIWNTWVNGPIGQQELPFG